MNEQPKGTSSRREFLKKTGGITGATVLASATIPHVHAARADDDEIRVALIGCGGRGNGAAGDALSTASGPIKLVAMADVFEHKMSFSYQELKNKFQDQVDVPEDRRSMGFDAYKEAMDALRPGDIAIFATPPAFRWVHFKYAIEKNLNVFMEKPVTVDGPTSVRMLELGKKAAAKNLKVGVGLMSRHSRALQELQSRIQDGQIGDIVLMRGYRMTGPVASFNSEKWPGTPSELLWQLDRFHSFIWASGGCFNDFYIHVIDHCCWMKNAWPVKAQALGGRHYRQSPDGVPYVDQNFDTYSVEYTFEDGATLLFDGRCMIGCDPIYGSHIHGTKGMAIGSKSGDCGMPSSIYTSQTADRSKRTWVSKVERGERDPYQNEWNDLIDAIRNDKPYSEVERGVMASAVGSLGRFAAHTGKVTTLEKFLNSDHEYAPGLDKLTMDSPAPVQANSDGKYPVPLPGIITTREY